MPRYRQVMSKRSCGGGGALRAATLKRQAGSSSGAPGDPSDNTNATEAQAGGSSSKALPPRSSTASLTDAVDASEAEAAVLVPENEELLVAQATADRSGPDAETTTDALAQAQAQAPADPKAAVDDTRLTVDKFKKIAAPLIVVVGGTSAGDNDPRAHMIAEPTVFSGHMVDGPLRGAPVSQMGWRQTQVTTMPIGGEGSEKAEVEVTVTILIKEPEPELPTPVSPVHRVVGESKSVRRKSGRTSTSQADGSAKSKKALTATPLSKGGKQGATSASKEKKRKRVPTAQEESEVEDTADDVELQSESE